MRRTTLILALVVILGTTLLAQAQARAASGWIPSADYCGWVWRDPSNTNHNGVDIRTSYPADTGFNGSTKGYPVQLATDGVLRQLFRWNGVGVVYGLRFYHPALNQSTFYWHMGNDAATVSYVESTLAIGTTYPAGTFLGYQGNLAGNGSLVVHLHITLANGEPTSDNGLPVGVGAGIGLDPTSFFGTNLNGQNGGACYGAQNMQYPGSAPFPASPHNYPNNFLQWYVIVNAQPTAPVTRAEFCNLLTESGFDHVYVYQFNTSDQSLTLVNDFSGHYTPPNLLSSAINGRVMFIQLTSDGSVTDYGFDVCNYHPF